MSLVAQIAVSLAVIGIASGCSIAIDNLWLFRTYGRRFGNLAAGIIGIIMLVASLVAIILLGVAG